MKKYSLTLILLFTILIIGCSGGDSSPTNNESSTNIASMNLLNASSLMIAPNGNNIGAKSLRRAPLNSNKLLKVTDNGVVEEVTYLDENNETKTNAYNPIYIGNVNTDYIIVAFGSDLSNVETTYLIQKSDGKIYNIEEKLYFPLNSTFIPTLFQTDGNKSNLYIPVSSYINNMLFSKILKLNVSDFNNITKEFILPEDDNLNQGFVMDRNGNSIYFAHKDAESQGYSRILKGNGAIKNLADTFFYWKGLDGTLYSLPRSSNGTITKHNIDNEFNYNESNITIPNGVQFNMTWTDHQIRTSNAIIFTHTDGILTEVDNASQTPRNIIADLTSIKAVNQNNNFYYIAGNNTNNDPVLRKFSITDDTYTDLLNAGDYEVYRFSVSSNNKVLFYALRMSDTQKVLGTISENGIVTVIDDTSNMEISAMEYIE